MTSTTDSRPPFERATPSLAAQIQRRAALQRATAKRAELAKIHAALRSGELAASNVLLNPPPALTDRMVWRVLLDAGVSTETLGELGDDAIKQNVNLAAPAGALSTRQRNWLAAELRQRRL